MKDLDIQHLNAGNSVSMCYTIVVIATEEKHFTQRRYIYGWVLTLLIPGKLVLALLPVLPYSMEWNYQ